MLLSRVRALAPLAHLLLSFLLVGLTTGVLLRIQSALMAQEPGHYVRPYGIGFVVPITLLTYLGGSRIGIATLLLSLLCSMYVLMAPRFSLVVHSPRDHTELVFLSSVGLLAVFGVDAMRRNAQLLSEMGTATAALQEASEQQQAFLRDVLLSVTDKKLRLCQSPAEMPPCHAPAAEPVPVRSESLRLLRQSALEAAKAQGFAEECCHDLITAVGEAAMNAVVHGGGGEARVCVGPGKTVQVWVEDKGAGITLENLPRATLERGHSTVGSLGHGFWLMLKTADRLWLLTGKTGTTLVLEQDPTAPELAWA